MSFTTDIKQETGGPLPKSAVKCPDPIDLFAHHLQRQSRHSHTQRIADYLQAHHDLIKELI